MTREAEPSALEIELQNAVIESIQNQKKSASEPSCPSEVFILPLLRRPFFPGMAAPILIEQGPFYEILKLIAKSEDRCIGLVLTKSEQADIYTTKLTDLYPVGILARILRIIPVDNGGAQVIFNMEKRLVIEGPASEETQLRAQVSYYEDNAALTSELKAYAISIISTIKELLKLNPLFKEELQIFLSHSDFTDPGRLADFAVALTTASREELQEVLSTFDIPVRIEKALLLLKKELDISMLQSDINKKIDAAITKHQKEFFLREQLKTIKKELGIERDDKSLDREKFEGRLKQRVVPEDVAKVINDEIEKLSVLETQSSEYALTRNYVDWLTNIPWGIYDKERHDIQHAKVILDLDHYGLKDIKERILEFIAVGKLSGNVKGSIICLVGPPGVGKTSVGKSIAKALNRKFFHFSVGGMRDEAEIKGHRRTYIGSMPGKLIQALKLCQVMNPVIMLDEVDKMGSSFHGDPAAALLEVLDPEQNCNFLDHYLDVRCDLSNVLFIVTANSLDGIPEPLKDRMEILRLSGYISQEKVEIANQYLIPKHRRLMGLKPKNAVFTKEALRQIIHGYAREAGVRNLENQIKKILRKVAVEIVQEQEENPENQEQQQNSVDIENSPKAKKQNKQKEPRIVPYNITPKNIKDYLGKPIFTKDRIYQETPIGVSTGLAWTSLGGAVLHIETIKIDADKPCMKLTGQAGSVMKESSEIAWSYLQSAVHKYDTSFFEKSQIHMHIPEGATPKDGPSAGITMVTALISLLKNQPILKDLGMTGEITLIGQVLAVGGIKEKFVAAKRAHLKEIILPTENERDYEELPDYVKEGINVHFVSHYDEVYNIAFPQKKAKKPKIKK